MSLYRIIACIRYIALVLMVLMVQQAWAGAAGDYKANPVKRVWHTGPVLIMNNAGEEHGVSWLHWLLDANPVYDVRNTTISLYQATESITFLPGFETPDGDEFVAEIVSNVSQVPPPSSNTGSANSDMNWIIAKSFDENGNVINETKSFFDNSGSALQMQNKVKFRKDAFTSFTHVFASQQVRDVLGREAVTTLWAPIDNSAFIYKPDFVRNGNGGTYDYRNFDRSGPLNAETDKTNNPDPIGGQNVQGTLGWYYSVNNTWEPYTPTTDYPYGRQIYYRDGTGNVKKSAGVGEVFKAGSGHEITGYTTPVVNELDHYVQVRNRFFSSSELGVLPTTLKSEAIQNIPSDANGRMSVVIQDESGNTLMTGRPGSDLTVSNTATVTPGNIFYFRTFATGNIAISSGTNEFYNMGTEQLVNIGTGGSIAAGYYKLVNTGTGDLTITYTNSYTDVSYTFYNQLGQVIATIAPEGVKKLYGSGINNYATKNDVPFITLNEYDLQGRLVKASSTDGGIRELVYRKDGKIRFSQNAKQKLTGSYSYVNYDQIGRPIESGEYQPDGGGIQFNSNMTATTNPMRDILEITNSTGGLTTGTKRDVVTILFDLPDNGHGLSGYTQDAINLGGTVSMTRKYSSIVNNTPNSTNIISSTWYNYDEERKVLWMIQYIKDLGYKTTEYAYDVRGRVIKNVFQKNTAAETFVHYYEYDQETDQLWKVYTNTADNPATKQLQASYQYYLHGALKRVELADKLQGIDYTYSLQGALKAINNSDKTKDPGGDGNNGFPADAFGMVLDYHTNDYVNNRGGIQPIKSVNTSGQTTDNYTAQIKAMTWFSRKPASMGGIPGVEDPITNIYKYDDKYQFIESIWGTAINFANTPATFTATGFNKETIKHPTTGVPAYDANGNIQYLQRTDGTGAIKDKFSYIYETNTNRLQAVMHDNNGTPQQFAGYTYDAMGQLIAENTIDPLKRKYIKYDVYGRVIAVSRNDLFTQPVAEYMYNETGQRIVKKLYNSSYQLSQIVYYVGDVIYTLNYSNGTPTSSQALPQEYTIDGGERIGIYFRQSNIYAYELKDHSGNVRAVIARSGSTYEVRMYTDYYPYGTVVQEFQSPEVYRHGYQGQFAERDPETDWNAFELRMYDSRIARWLSVDPENEFWSPYVGMGNDPVNNVDPDGGCTNPECRARAFAAKYEGSNAYQLNNGKWVVNYTNNGQMTSKVFGWSLSDYIMPKFKFDFNSVADLGFTTGWNSNIRIKDYVDVMAGYKKEYDAGRLTLAQASRLRYSTLIESRQKLTLMGKWMSQMFKSNDKAYTQMIKYIADGSKKMSVFTPNANWTKVAKVGRWAGPLVTFASEAWEYKTIITEKKTIEQVEDDYDSWLNPPLKLWRMVENQLKKLGPKGPIKPIPTGK